MCRSTLYKVISFIFVLILIIPCVGILREKRNVELIAEMENRTISSKPTATLFSAKFFSEAEDWFNDRLLGRKDLIRLWSSFNGKLFNILISKEIVMGKDGFLFFPFYLNDKIVDQEQKVETLVKIKELCKENGADFTVFIAPHSEWVFPELIPPKYETVDLKKLEKTTGEVFSKNGIDFCFIGQNFVENFKLEERKGLYYQGDYHWNDKGAYYGTKKLLMHLKLDSAIHKNISFKYEKGSAEIYTRKIGWDAIVSTVEVPWSEEFNYDFVEQSNIEGKLYDNVVRGASQKGEITYINEKAVSNVKVLILGDSFFDSMKNYLLQDVKTIIYTHNSGVSSPKKFIDVKRLLEKYKPDIVVYEKMGGFFYGHGYNTVFGNHIMK